MSSLKHTPENILIIHQIDPFSVFYPAIPIYFYSSLGLGDAQTSGSAIGLKIADLGTWKSNFLSQGESEENHGGGVGGREGRTTDTRNIKINDDSVYLDFIQFGSAR